MKTALLFVAFPYIWKRETEALQKLPNRLSCKRRLILTYDEEEIINDKHGTIEIVPVWKWLLENQGDRSEMM